MTDKNKIILQKIIGYIDDVAQYRQGFDFDSFLQDKKTVSACAFAVSQIGELAKELTDDFRSSHTAITWKNIIGMRNRIVHDYEKIDFRVLWGTVETSLPELKMQLSEIIEKL
jgi:uncharacterized protein with HEPN domain